MSSEKKELIKEVERLKKALRKAPMPYRESILSTEEWDDAYDKWWHENASENAINPR